MEESGKTPLVENFCSVTGANQREARRYLAATDWQIDAAVELYMSSGNGEDKKSTEEISELARPPIPSRSGVLVGETFTASYAPLKRRAATNSVFDAFRNFQAEEVEVVAEKAGTSGRPSSEAERKRKTLENLFKPPLHLIHRGSFESAKLEAVRKTKWLLVNLQDVQEFDCQVLNRDVWNNSVVSEMVRANFVFWQVTSESADGRQYQTYYQVNSWPHVAVLDPRTGESVLVLTKFDRMSICDSLTSFLERKPTFNDSVNGATKSHENSTKRKLESSSQASHDLKRSKQSTSTNGSANGNYKDSQFLILDANGSIISDQLNMPDLESFLGNSWPKEMKKENYRDYVGETGDEIQILLKLPDGSKDKLSLKSSSLLKAVFLYLSDIGYPSDKYELALNFPSRMFNSDSHQQSSLEELHFNRQETIFVQEV